MINRPENIYSYMFTGLFILQTFILLFSAATLPPVNEYEELVLSAANSLATAEPQDTTEPMLHPPSLSIAISAAGDLVFQGKMRLFGYRIFHLLLSLAGFFMFFQLVKKQLGGRIALYSSCFLSSAFFFNWQLIPATPAALATVGTGIALFSFFLYLKTTKDLYFWFLYGGIALGVLLGGLAALIIPFLVMVLYLMFRVKMNARHLKKIKIVPGLLLIASLVLGWNLLFAGVTDGEYLQALEGTLRWSCFVEEQRSLHNAFYWPFILIFLLTLPFGLFFPGSFSYSWKYRHKKELLLLSALFVLTLLLFYSFSETLYPHFLLPAFPFAAILFGYRFSQMAGRPLQKMNLKFGTTLLVVLALVLPVLLFIAPETSPDGIPEMVLFILLLAVLPLGTLTGLAFWLYKRTDEGILTITISWLIFNALLLRLVPAMGGLGQYIMPYLL